MKNNIIFISFYTKDTIYEKAIKEYLLPSLNLFHLSYWIKEIDNRGTWAKNTCQKPAVILEALNQFSEDVVWIDADAEIKEYPKKFDTIKGKDIGIHYLKWEEHYGRPSDKGKTELIDGTIYVKNNEKMISFITEWKQNSTDKERNHQKILERMLKQRPDIKVWDFGREYCYIIQTPHGKNPHKILEYPVIIHHQLSREGKKKLK